MIESPQAIRVFVSNLDIAKEWYSQALEQSPAYRDENTVTYFVSGCTLTLCLGNVNPHAGARVYWAVDDLPGEHQRLGRIGRETADSAQLLDAHALTAEVLDPFGNVFGLMAIDETQRRKSRMQRVSERLALQNVRGTLDQIEQSENEHHKNNRVVGILALAALVLMVLVVWGMVMMRAPIQSSLPAPLPKSVSK